MNYYERHLGDYAKDTAHLTMLEHGAYTLLLDRYYATETPIPADQAHRLARARTKEEREAVDAVLAEFFLQTEAGWVNRRADEEIEKAQVRIETAKVNGKRGGRPRKNPSGSENETQKEPAGFSLGSENKTQPEPSEKLTKHQTPDTNNQKKKRPASAELALLLEQGIEEPLARDFLAVRKAKKAVLTRTALEGILTQVEKAGVTLETALRTCCERGWAGFKAEWPGARPNGGGQAPERRRELL